MSNQSSPSTSDSMEQPSEPGGKEYTPPKLEAYGTILELTGGPASGSLDQLFGGDGGFQTPVS